jgi:L-threonylcarbamoyladenylate synthase
MAVSGDAVKLLAAWHDGRVDTGAVAAAAAVLRDGGLVGLPTETVYGLAARATDRAAVGRVFEVKGRPADHPVIVHVDGVTALDTWGREVPDYTRALAAALWPAPLTFVVPAADDVPRYLTGGQDTVGLRCPAHPVALAVIEAAGPLAAPSANLFGRVSPTSAADVVRDLPLDPARDLVLDGGDCPVGVESTILDCTGDQPTVLRWGAVETSDIQRLTGRQVRASGSAVRAPGGLASHYAPAAAVHLTGDAPPGGGFLAQADVPTPPGAVRLAEPRDTRAYAACLYRALRDADAAGLPAVWAVPPDDATALAAAVRDRLTRAAAR